MTLKQFRENIWWQLGFLLMLAVLCGVILGTVWYVASTHKPPKTYDAGIYKTVYGENYTYTLDENFKEKTVTTASHSGTVTAEEKVNVNDGAKIVKISADVGGLVKLEMYIVVNKDDSAEYIYFTKTGATWISETHNYVIENNIMQVKDIPKTSSATYTLDTLTTAVKLAQDA